MAKELIEQRSPNAKLFDLGGSKRRLVQSAAPVHYLDDSGQLQDIGTSPQFERGRWRMEATAYKFALLSSTAGYSYTSRNGGQVTVELAELNDQPVRNLTIEPRIDNNKIWLDEVVPGLDIYFELLPRRVRTWKIVKSPDAPHILTWQIIEDNPSGNVVVRKQTRGKDNYNLLEVPERADDRRLQRLLEILHTAGQPDNKGQYTLREEITGRTAIIDRATRIKQWQSDVIVYPLLVDADVEEAIVANADDGFTYGEEPPWYNSANGRFYFGLAYYFQGTLNAGVRFRTINIPQGATIDTATLRLYSDYLNGDPTGNIYGDDVDDAAIWSNSSRPIQVTKTSASTAISGILGPGNWNEFDVTGIIQEIISRGGWSANNDLRLALLENEPTLNHQVGFYDYNQGPTNAAQLIIDFTVAAGGLNIQVAMHSYRKRRV